MKLMRHKVTGRIGEYPDHFNTLFPSLELAEETPCVDCIPEVEYEDEFYDYEMETLDDE